MRYLLWLLLLTGAAGAACPTAQHCGPDCTARCAGQLVPMPSSIPAPDPGFWNGCRVGRCGPACTLALACPTPTTTSTCTTSTTSTSTTLSF